VPYNGDPNVRTITGGDAHAWVEINFPDYGWTRFDPTPAEPRVIPPPYMTDNSPAGGNDTQPSNTGKAGPTSTTAAKPTAPTQATPIDTQTAADTSLLNPTAPPAWFTALVLLLALALSVLLTAKKRPGRAFKLTLPRWIPPKWVAPAFVGAWALFVLVLTSYASWWLTGLVLVLMAVAAPAAVRAWRRRRRLHQIAALGSEAAGAAWAEIIAESVDRGTVVPPTETVRAAGRRLAREHELDEPGREALRQLITAVEGSWYGGRETADPALVAAVDELRASMHRTAPLAFTARVLPRSVVSRR
jgi:hypothetical protein